MTDQTFTIPKDWKMTTLGKVAEKIVDNRGKTPPIKSSGFELLEVNTISESQRTPDYSRVTKFVDEDSFKNWFRTGVILKNDILIPTVGTIGNVSFSKISRGAIAQNLIAIRTDTKRSEPLFIYYLLKNPASKNKFLNLDIGGVQPSIKVPHLLAMEILVPPLPEQRVIMAVLSTLDDKIELLREQNQTLEATAQAVFKEWFIKPSVDKKLPKGWSAGGLSEIANFLNGIALQKYSAAKGEDSLPAIKIRELNAGITDATDRVSKDLPEQYIIHDGDILFSWSGSLEVVIWQHGDGALNQHLFKVTSEKYPKWFYYFWLLRHLPSFRAIAANKATTMGHIQRYHLDKAEVVIPDDATIKELDALMDPILNKVILNNSQVKGLTKLRNTILPKLMSGKIRV